jgi:hypothetical protein
VLSLGFKRSTPAGLLATGLLVLGAPARGQAPIPADTGTKDLPQATEVAAGPRVVARIFGDVDWHSRRDDLPNTFTVGQLALFLSSELAPNLSLIAEVAFEIPEDAEAQIAEVERLHVRWAPFDAVNFSVGRMHTMLGHWNQAYHHGTWLQTTAFRPEVYRWEDEGGGLLPVHEVGVRLGGALSGGPLRVEYSASLANGRGETPEQVVTVQDRNGSKAVSLWLGLRPEAVPGLQLGGTAVFDTIPPGPDDAARGTELRERILGGFLVYHNPRIELLAEAFGIRHEDESEGRAWTTTGLYAQAAFIAGRLKPYYRFDLVDRNQDDPFFGPDTPGVEKHTVGLRVDHWSRLAVKLELSHNRLDPGGSFGAGALQVAFAF